MYFLTFINVLQAIQQLHLKNTKKKNMFVFLFIVDGERFTRE